MRALTLRGACLGAAAAVVALALGSVLWRADASGASWFLAAAISAMLFAAAGALTFRGSDRTVDAVRGSASLLAAGSFNTRVTATGGPMAELTSSFNGMARRVEELFGQVAAEQARLEAVFDASADGMLALSRDTAVRYMNTAARRLLEVSDDLPEGRPLIESARDYELDALVRRLTTGTSAGPQTALITFGPRRIPLRAAALPIDAGGDWAVLLVLTDLTDVTRIDQMRRDFLSNVSHELRTPLASVRALAETLESGNVDPGEETAEFVGRIRQQVDRLTALVNELLDLSRIESGAVQLQPEPIDLAALVAESASLLRQRADEAEVAFQLPYLPGPTVEADHASLLRVTNNLLDNAIKYAPRGSSVWVTTVAEGDLVAIAVRDEGAGIPPQDLPRVFERFYKGDHSRANSGVGLGLAIVKHVIRAHGGTVEVTSEVGNGATFTVRLPRQFAGTRPQGR